MPPVEMSSQDRLRELRRIVNGPTDRYGEAQDESMVPSLELPGGLSGEALDARAAASPPGMLPPGAVQLPETQDEGLTLPGIPSAPPSARPSAPTADRAREAMADVERRRTAAASKATAEREANAARTEAPASGPMRSPARQGDSGVVLAEGGETPAATMQRKRQEMAEQRRKDQAVTPESAQDDSDDMAAKAKQRAGDVAQGRKEQKGRREALGQKRATERARAAQEAWWAEHQAWQSQMDHAIDTGNQPLQARLAAAEPKQPRPDLEATGGQTLEEIQESVDVTLEKVRAADPAAAEALDSLPPDSLNANFSDMPPEERLQAMQVAGQRLASTRGWGGVEVSGLPGRSRGGVGDGGTRLMPPVNRGPRSDYPNTPRSENEDLHTGGPRRTPYSVGSAYGGMGPQTAPEESTSSLIDTIDLDKPTFDRREKQIILYAAHQMGMDISGYGTSAQADMTLMQEAKRMLRDHQRQVGVTAIPANEAEGYAGRESVVGKKRIIASDNPETPYRYAETPAAKKARETRDLTRRTHEYMGSHPMPDTLQGVTVNSTIDKNEDGELNDPVDLHTALLDAAASGDMDTYQAIRQKLRGAEIQGQRAMMVQRRKMRAMQYQMEDPEINRAVFASAMRDAGDDPAAQANVYRMYGMADEANRVMELQAQEAGIADSRAARDRKLDIDQQQVDFPKGREQPQQNAIQAVDAMMAPIAAGALQQPGIGAVKEAERVGAAAQMTATESRRVFARQFMKQPGASAAHAAIQECMRQEWENTQFFDSRYYGQQFIDNCVQNLGVSEQDAINWLKTYKPQEMQRMPGGAQQAPQPAQPAFTPDMTNGGP